MSGSVLSPATVATRVLLAVGVTLVGYAGLRLAQGRLRGAQAGRRRAVALAAAPGAEQQSAEPSLPDEQVEGAEQVEDAETPQVPVFLLEQLMQEAMDDEIAQALADGPADEPVEEQAQDLSVEITAEERTLELVDAQDAGVAVPEPVTHDLVPISSLHEARAEAERVSLQRIQATVRGLSARTGDDPVAADVLARVVAAVDRLMVPDSFERPVLSETRPLLAAAAAAAPAAPPAQEATPLPSVPTMRPSDMPVTELSSPGLPHEALATAIADEAPAPAPETQPIEAVVVEDPDLVLPIPAPPRPQPAPRGRRLRRNSVA